MLKLWLTEQFHMMFGCTQDQLVALDVDFFQKLYQLKCIFLYPHIQTNDISDPQERYLLMLLFISQYHSACTYL
jgi:hypothetical protein